MLLQALEEDVAYCSCFMAPIKKTDVSAYRETARETAALFKSLGALEVTEYLGDDTPQVEIATMSETLCCAPDETVIMGWSVWPSKEVFDACNAELQENPQYIKSSTNYDTKRLILGNFRAAD